ncbi:MAG: hypothetical protein ABL994_20130, partial [Verrucomicrobiales bacterium]
MEPINEFLNYIGLVTDDLPFVRAAIILLGGTLVAMLIKVIVRGLLNQTGIDERMARALGLRDTNTEQAISQFIFLSLMLAVIIVALNEAGLTQVTVRLQALIDPIIQALPRIFFAGALAFLTWLFATLVTNLLQGILTASRLDARLGLDGESRPLSRAILAVVATLIGLIMLPLILSTLGIPEISAVLNPQIAKVMTALPDVMFGGLIIGFGVFVGSIVRTMVTAALEGIRLDSLPASLGYQGSLSLMGLTLSSALGVVAMISIIVTMTEQGLDAMHLDVSGVATLLRNLWAATLIFVVGLFLADLANKAIGP